MAETMTDSASLAAGDATKAPDGASSGSAPSATSAATPPASPPKLPLSKIYALPVPIRTFPLPTFYPNNPISLLHLVYAWLCQVLRPPPPEPSVIHIGVWDPGTRSVHVKDPASIRALWEQGFFGKGSLSRSEPNWMKRELARRGSPEGKTVSEARTELRREERRLAKWERAKAELEAIERQRRAEAASRAADAGSSKLNGQANGHSGSPAETAGVTVSLPGSASKSGSDDAVAGVAATAPPASASQVKKPERAHVKVKAPVGPAELLALPNSLVEANSTLQNSHQEPKPPVGPVELLSLPNSLADLVSRPESGNVNKTANGQANSGLIGGQPRGNGDVNGQGHAVKASAFTRSKQAVDEVSTNTNRLNGVSNGELSPTVTTPDELLAHPPAQDKDKASQPLKRRKSVRFSPTVESTTFLHSDPPSPNRSAGASSKSTVSPSSNKAAVSRAEVSTILPLSDSPKPPVRNRGASADPSKIENKEHFQLAPEEAFFLVFSLGALTVVDPDTGSPIPTERLLTLFRSHSYFPPRPTTSTSPSTLGPDDPFLVHYAVYHHFRSLGWVPRHGIKFGVDWILYQRGPVFDHSEFGLMVMPAFSDSRWEGHEHAHDVPRRSWSWLMGVNRVLSHVLKSLVLVYVDIPPPPVFDECMRRGGIAEALTKYTIREVMVRRFSVNRNR